jgi:hypothetical protein
VAEHHVLDVLVHLGPPRGSEQAEVTEGEGHGRSWSLVTSTASSGQRSRFWCLTTPRLGLDGSPPAPRHAHRPGPTAGSGDAQARGTSCDSECLSVGLSARSCAGPIADRRTPHWPSLPSCTTTRPTPRGHLPPS